MSDLSAERCVVIYRLGSIGDTVVALPCFHKIAQEFPDAERIVLTNVSVSAVAAPLEMILGPGKLITGCIKYGLSTRSFAELLDLRRRLRATGSRTVIYLAASRGLFAARRDLIFFWMCGFKRIIGIPLTRDLQENRAEPATGFVERECERLARTLAELGPIDLHDVGMWDLLLTPEELNVGAGIKKQFKDAPFIAIHVGGKAAENNWGEKNWRALLQRISDTHGQHGLLLLGADEDRRLYDGVVPDWPSEIINACGKLTPRESAAALRHARLFVGHDSGPLHLASISGVACVGLMGSRNLPRKWHPYIGKNRIVHRPAGIASIGVDEVANAIDEIASMEW